MIFLGNMASSTIAAQNYHDDFDSKSFLKYYAEVNEWHDQPMRLLHQLYVSYGTTPVGLKVLNFGSGPVIMYEISAPLQASEIVMAEYTEENRRYLQHWLDKDPEAHDWSPFFKYAVMKFEGKSEQEATEREEQLRKLIKAVVPCDITKDPPIQAGYEGPYDVIVSSLCLDCASQTLEDYGAAVSKLSKLLKPGGKICLNSVEGIEDTNFYMVGSQKFHGLNVTEQQQTTILKERGFYDIQVTRQPRDTPGVNIPQEAANFTATFFTIATKRQ